MISSGESIALCLGHSFIGIHCNTRACQRIHLQVRGDLRYAPIRHCRQHHLVVQQACRSRTNLPHRRGSLVYMPRSLAVLVSIQSTMVPHHKNKIIVLTLT